MPINSQASRQNLLSRLTAEKGRSRADVFWSRDVAFKEGKPVEAVFPDQQSFGTLVLPSVLVLMANGRNPERGKRFIDFLLRPEIQKLLGVSRGIPRLDDIKPMEVDYVKLIAQSEELSRGFLKEWVDKQK